MTYSIVARDPASGELGVAVQSAMFDAGAVVPWARAGVGAVATQAISETAYGPRCLDALAGGMTAADGLEAARAQDPAAALRQVGVVAAAGPAAAFTGELCIDHAGHLAVHAFAVQANMMATPEVWPAMAEAYAGAEGPLARRMLAALDAAQAAGGDARGVMSAAMVVVAGEPAGPGGGRVVDLRVDHSDDPLGELRRLLDVADAYGAFTRAVDMLMGGDAAGSLAEADAALALLPGDENLAFIRAGALVAQGKDEGRSALDALIARRGSWDTVIRSFQAKGLMP
jgi:uncharacterized Ntn-hydrolase superfamily protein